MIKRTIAEEVKAFKQALTVELVTTREDVKPMVKALIAWLERISTASKEEVSASYAEGFKAGRRFTLMEQENSD